MFAITNRPEAAAYSLNRIREMAEQTEYVYGAEESADTYRYHAPAANRYIEIIHEYGGALPAWVLLNSEYFSACGWRIPATTKREPPAPGSE